jgi:hypothetical protein
MTDDAMPYALIWADDAWGVCQAISVATAADHFTRNSSIGSVSAVDKN